MSKDSEKYRAEAKKKVERLTRVDPKTRIDASNYTPPDELMPEVKTGMRPISKRQFKKGGMVKGKAAKHHAGRKGRAAGGDANGRGIFGNANLKDENMKRAGEKHVGGFKKGGNVHGPDFLAKERTKHAPEEMKTEDKTDRASRDYEGYKKGGHAKRRHRDDGGLTDQDTASQRIQSALGTGAKSSTSSEQKNYSGLSQSDRDEMNAKMNSMGNKRGGHVRRRDNGGPVATPAPGPGDTQTSGDWGSGGQNQNLRKQLGYGKSHGGEAKRKGRMAGGPAGAGSMTGANSMNASGPASVGMGSTQVDPRIAAQGQYMGGLPASEAVPTGRMGFSPSRTPLSGQIGIKRGGHVKGHSVPGNNEITGTRPTGGRLAKADGGKASKKGAVNIIIAVGGHKPDQGQGMPPAGVPHPPPPPQPLGGAANGLGPMPPNGGMPMAGGPPGAMPPGGMPPGGMPPGGPPMRKHGGAVSITHAAGGGEGRLEKARKYGQGV